jgi:hypothetical protein
METVFIQSTDKFHAPNAFRYVLESVRPYDVAMAARMLDRMGLPIEACLAVMDGEFHWMIESDGETVRLVTYH